MDDPTLLVVLCKHHFRQQEDVVWLSVLYSYAGFNQDTYLIIGMANRNDKVPCT